MGLHAQSTPAEEIAYVEFTSPVSITATAEATPNDVVSSGALFYAAERVCIEFFSPRVTIGATAGSFVVINLWDDATNLGRLALCSPLGGTAGGGGDAADIPVLARRFLTPTAGMHTYKVRGWRVNSDGTIEGSTGGAGATFAGYIRVSRS